MSDEFDLAPLEEPAAQDTKRTLSLLDQQRYDHRTVLFRFVLLFCCVCYFLCFGYLVLLVCNDNFLVMFVHSRHLALLGACLFLVPSFILGKVLHAVFGQSRAADEQANTPLEAVTKHFGQ